MKIATLGIDIGKMWCRPEILDLGGTVRGDRNCFRYLRHAAKVVVEQGISVQAW